MPSLNRQTEATSIPLNNAIPQDSTGNQLGNQEARQTEPYSIRNMETPNVQDSHTSTGSTSPRVLLEYPRNFFHQETGVGPSTSEEAALLWIYRKGRRTDGLADTEPPDGNLMLQEIKEIRDSLHAHIQRTYENGLRDRAKELDIQMPGKAAFPVHLTDFRKILNELPCTLANQRMVFELVLQFHKDRHWLAHAIDRWFDKEGMTMAPLHKPKFVNGKRTRICPTDRGGFSAVARSAKSAIVGGLMAPMLRNAGWSVSLTKNQGKKHNYETKVQYNQSQSFYVVTQEKKVRRQNWDSIRYSKNAMPNLLYVCQGNKHGLECNRSR